MIWCIPESDYPTREDWRSEELKYQDDNSFEWRIARVDNGIMVRYFGDPYFNREVGQQMTQDDYLRQMQMYQNQAIGGMGSPLQNAFLPYPNQPQREEEKPAHLNPKLLLTKKG